MAELRFFSFCPSILSNMSRGNADLLELIICKGKVYLCVIFQKTSADINLAENPIILGLNRGINKVAVCSDNSFFNGNINKLTALLCVHEPGSS